MGIADHPFGLWNKWTGFHDPGIRGFLSREKGLTNPTFITRAAGVDGPYSAKNIPDRLYGNVDWRGTVGARTEFLTWDGPIQRYTNSGTIPSTIIVGNTTGRQVFKQGRLFATAPTTVIGAALKRIVTTIYIRVICVDWDTEEWVAHEKVQDAEPLETGNWTEVGRFAWTDTATDPELTALDIRKQYQLEAHAFFNGAANKAIGIFTGMQIQALGATVPHGFNIDFDWPETAGGPVTFGTIDSGLIVNTVTNTSVPPGVSWNEVLAGSVIAFRDFDDNGVEKQGVLTGSGTRTFSASGAGTPCDPLSWSHVNAQKETLTVNATAIPKQERNNVQSKFTDGTTFTASQVSTTDTSSQVGIDMRNGYVSSHEIQFTENLTGGSTLTGTRTQPFEHNSQFGSSLGLVNHVTNPGISVPSSIGFFAFMTSLLINPTAVRDQVWHPQRILNGNFAFAYRSFFTGGHFQHTFDTFGNELVFLNFTPTIPNGPGLTPPIVNPALPQTNLLSGDDLQSLHDVLFVMDQIAIA